MENEAFPRGLPGFFSWVLSPFRWGLAYVRLTDLPPEQRVEGLPLSLSSSLRASEFRRVLGV
jgi:hypothetical protein